VDHSTGQVAFRGDFGTMPARTNPNPTLGKDAQVNVADFYDIDAANDKLPELREALLRLSAQRDEVVAVRDRIIELNAPALAGGSAQAPGSARTEGDRETGRLRMRMQGLVDQMQAAVLELDGSGIQLRDIGTGLVDFPALVAGRPIWLCWRLGEERVEWWHEASEGFDARHRIEDLF
jgi:hypothetical protein